MVAAVLDDAKAKERAAKPAERLVAKPKAAAQAKTDVTRLNLVLPAKSIERLDRLKQTTEATSYAEVIRNAIRLYEAIVGEYEKGHKVQILDAHGKPMSLSIF